MAETSDVQRIRRTAFGHAAVIAVEYGLEALLRPTPNWGIGYLLTGLPAAMKSSGLTAPEFEEAQRAWWTLAGFCDLDRRGELLAWHDDAQRSFVGCVVAEEGRPTLFGVPRQSTTEQLPKRAGAFPSDTVRSALLELSRCYTQLRLPERKGEYRR